MSDPAREPARRLKVRGMVLERNKRPYVEMFDERRECIARVPTNDAYTLCQDIGRSAARAEADAMIYRFFKREHFPEDAAKALMEDFRVFRAELDGTIGKPHEHFD